MSGQRKEQIGWWLASLVGLGTLVSLAVAPIKSFDGRVTNLEMYRAEHQPVADRGLADIRANSERLERMEQIQSVMAEQYAVIRDAVIVIRDDTRAIQAHLLDAR
jgi:hypothetical protein